LYGAFLVKEFRHAGAPQTGDQAAAHWVRRHRKDDRDERCRLLCREDCTSRRDNDIDPLSRTNSAAISAKFYLLGSNLFFWTPGAMNGSTL
jgi:hypothetical protein